MQKYSKNLFHTDIYMSVSNKKHFSYHIFFLLSLMTGRPVT